MSRPVLFWDSAALIRAILKPRNDPYRQLLEWGEAGVVDNRISRDVLREVEHVVARFDDNSIADLASILDRADFAIASEPDPGSVRDCYERTGYLPDARIVAAAHECNAEFLLTFDRAHLLGNPLLGPPDTNSRVVTPHECLDLLLDRIT